MHPIPATHHPSTWRPHRIVGRLAETNEPDFTELGSFTCGDVALSAKHHQVVAMFASGFQSDRIIADYLDIKTKYVQAIVAELKKKYGWQNRREIGRAYRAMRQTVNPKGAMPMKPVMRPVSANGHTAVVEPPVEPEPPVAESGFDPANFYPVHVIEAADAELEKAARSRRCSNVFTAEVVAVWLDWIDEGRSMLWIAENNGLIPTSHITVSSYIKKHQAEANQLRGKAETETDMPRPEPAAPDPVPDLTEVAVQLAKVITAAAALKSISVEIETERTKKGLKVSLEVTFNK